MTTLVVISVVYIAIEAIIGLCTGELRSVSTYIAAITIGFFVALFTDSNIPLTVAVALCFEELILGIISVIAFISFSIAENKSKKTKKSNKKVDDENMTNKVNPDKYNPNLGNAEIKAIQSLEGMGIHLQLDGIPITVHNLSTKLGYYKDVAYWEDGADEYFRKWIDKETSCLYNIIDEVNGETESIAVTKDIFEAMHDKFYKKHDHQQVSLFDAITAEPPILDLNGLAFADEETQQKELRKYAEDMYDYIKRRMKNEELL
ncbi:MAG: hypothetical protein IJ423_05480 [Clostridia bacterium]|nr:hypothetical protein [Clostridia bacterium]MBQ8637421.1 hypothetical protein [Clostridia bacterium]